ncbi:Uncharacterised protein [uncultured archaeon]|nr:Uncharacterised protein [uncultured archaeon]
MRANKSKRLQSSFELLITLSLGLAVLMPIVIIAFIQLANSNTALSSVESQQAASKLSSIATLVGSEGAPAKQLVQISVPPNVKAIYVGTMNNTIGHEIIFVVSAPSGSSYVTSYTPVNVSGSLGGISSTGTYLVNVTALSSCPTNGALPCVYLSPKV